MRSRGFLVIAAVLAAAGCGRVTDLEPAPGHSMPVKPESAREALTFDQLLKAPTQARPDRVDELMKRSQPRPNDPFELPPPTGGNAPSGPAGTAPGPVTSNSSATIANPGD